VGESRQAQADTRQAPSPRADDQRLLELSADLRPLDRDELALLRQIGERWPGPSPNGRASAPPLPIDPGLCRYPAAVRARRGRFVPVECEPPDGAGEILATERANEPLTPGGRLLFRARRALLGPPRESSAVGHERMRKLVALPVLSSDALSSVAYGPEAMLAVLAVAGASALSLSLPLGAVIALMIIVVGASYRQTIRAYPHGGGSYIVAGDNFGPLAGLTAGAGLMIDYVMTVAVSIAAGTQAVTSALPSLRSASVVLGIAVIAVLLAGNLRGVRQAGAMFAAPTYLFIVAMFLLLGVGLVDAAGRGFHAEPPPSIKASEGITLLLILRAFASGATSMTGVEAISNAIPAFRPPQWRNARTTLTCMIALLLTLFAGTVLLTHVDGVVPQSHQTVLSQLAHLHLGSGFLYGFVQAATAGILLLAANTAFNDFPRLLFFMARDSYAPKAFLHVGDRLAFSNGIVALAVVAGLIFVAFGGRTGSLIPLYAVGVFLAFTLSQAGMVAHWWRHRDHHWRRSITINAAGAVLSALVLLIAAITKFTDGAWLVVVLLPIIIVTCLRIHRYYAEVEDALRLRPLEGSAAPHHGITAPRPEENGGAPVGEAEEAPDQLRHLMVAYVASLNLASMRALAYAASLGQPVLAVHLSPDEEEATRFEGYWHVWGDHLPLEIVISPYRATVAPLARYIQAIHQQRPELVLTVIVPEIVDRHWRHQLLQSRVAARLRRVLRMQPETVIADVPFHLAH
jgi:amino acid transporter